MSFSPLDLLDEDYSGLFSQDYRQSNDKVSRKEPKNKLHETENAHDAHFLDTKNDYTGFKNYPEIVETVVVDQNKQSDFPNEFNLHESTNQMTDDKHSYTEYSKIDIDDEKPIKTKENHVNNLQFNLVHDINEVNINTRKNNSIISSDINDNMEYIEVKQSEKDTNKPSNEIEPVIKPAVRTRRHISNSSNQPRICDITLTNENDQSPINTLVISSKEQQNIINDNNDQCITDIIIKSTSQSGDNVHLSPKSSIKRSKSTCSMSNQRVTNRSTYQAYRKSDDFILNAAAIRELAYQSWCNRLVKSARIERMSNLRNEIDETKKEKEKLERLKSNEICFQTWKRNKHQQLIDTIKKRKEEELAQKKKLEEEQERKLNSQKAFDVWKSRKDELTIKQLRDCLSKQKLEKQSKVTEQNEKQHLKGHLQIKLLIGNDH
ncbi:microtubule-associated protein 9 (Aster-associated protein) [Schistosoma japonicum]|nr:microtubule-associated protein 9 (Aster-associated protein) [Schistosoma japonicum]